MNNHINELKAHNHNNLKYYACAFIIVVGIIFGLSACGTSAKAAVPSTGSKVAVCSAVALFANDAKNLASTSKTDADWITLSDAVNKTGNPYLAQVKAIQKDIVNIVPSAFMMDMSAMQTECNQ